MPRSSSTALAEHDLAAHLANKKIYFVIADCFNVAVISGDVCFWAIRQPLERLSRTSIQRN